MAEYQTPPGRPYRGPSGVARDSVWLTNEDLPHDRDVVVTIENVMIRDEVKFAGGRVKHNVISLKFVGKQRELGLTAACNRKTMNLLYTTNVANWVGKRVILFVEKNVGLPDGTRGPAVRIRAREPEPEKPKQTHPTPQEDQQ